MVAPASAAVCSTTPLRRGGFSAGSAVHELAQQVQVSHAQSPQQDGAEPSAGCAAPRAPNRPSGELAPLRRSAGSRQRRPAPTRAAVGSAPRTGRPRGLTSNPNTGKPGWPSNQRRTHERSASIRCSTSRGRSGRSQSRPPARDRRAGRRACTPRGRAAAETGPEVSRVPRRCTSAQLTARHPRSATV